MNIKLGNYKASIRNWNEPIWYMCGDQTVRGSNPTAENVSLRNFGNSVYPALPVSFGGDTKSRRSLLSGVYARGSTILINYLLLFYFNCQ